MSQVIIAHSVARCLIISLSACTPTEHDTYPEGRIEHLHLSYAPHCVINQLIDIVLLQRIAFYFRLDFHFNETFLCFKK